MVEEESDLETGPVQSEGVLTFSVVDAFPIVRVEHFWVREVFQVLIVLGWLAYHAHMVFPLV